MPNNNSVSPVLVTSGISSWYSGRARGQMLLTRDAFREGVFLRDGCKCVICGRGEPIEIEAKDDSAAKALKFFGLPTTLARTADG